MEQPKSRAFASLGALLLAGLSSRFEKASYRKFSKQKAFGKAKAFDPIIGLRRKRPMARYQHTRGY